MDSKMAMEHYIKTPILSTYLGTCGGGYKAKLMAHGQHSAETWRLNQTSV